MKKNGQYVGVDEQHIPEDEKYVDNATNEELKDLINDGARAVRNFVSDSNNQDKIKNAGKKGVRIVKGIGIGYLTFFGFIMLMIVLTYILVFTNIFSIMDLMRNVAR